MKIIKEPIKNKGLWIFLGILFVLSVPWYLPAGSYKPVILGLPYWAWIVVLVSIAFSATITYAIKYLWVTTADEEETKEGK